MAQRTITSQPKFGQEIDVEVPTHVTGILHFAGGVSGVITTSFDVWAAQLPRIEIYGTEGTLSVPNPNTFGGPVKIKRANGSLAYHVLDIMHRIHEAADQGQTLALESTCSRTEPLPLGLPNYILD